MIYRIEIVNNQNNEKITFLNHYAWKSAYGITCTNSDIQIARDYKTFKLMNNAETGFYGLPTNNLVTESGINQNGEDLQFNYYSVRNMLFRARVFKALMNDIDIVLQQNDISLTMNIYNENGEAVTIQVNCLGNYENGDFEFVSTTSSFFEEPELSEIDFIVDQGSNGKVFFPFKPNSIYFESAVPNNLAIIESPSNSYVRMLLNGTFTNVHMTNLLNGDIFNVDTTTNVSLEINSQNLTVTNDGTQLNESQFSGVFPSLISGTNRFLIEFDNAIYPIAGKIYYKRQYGSVK